MLVGAGVALAALALAVGVGLMRTPPGPPVAPSGRAARILDAATRFYVPPPRTAAIQQITALAEGRALREAALITALEAVPRAVYFDAASPDEVEAGVRTMLARATHDGGIPVLVAYQLPFRDCAQYGAGGARDAAAYRAWIEGFVRGIGSQTAIVILEPDSLGIVPHGRFLDGTADWCKPTITDAQGRTVPAPGATADEHYAMLTMAIDRLVAEAPNAYVYLDGTNSAWLPVSEIAYRLARVGVDRVQGFALNVGNSQPTSETIKYGTWISNCLAYAGRHSNAPAAFRECPGPPRPADPGGAVDWDAPETWYRNHAEPAAQVGPPTVGRAHFVIDTGRAGRGTLDVSPYSKPPFNQPPEIIAKLRIGGYCNPPNAGAGARPTARTGIPLVDAFLWIKPPGESDGSCDSAGGVRAWDYAKFNPWRIAGETQKHFDPLWSMIDPEAGEWFPEAALQLALNANPPLDQGEANAAGSPRSGTLAVAATDAGLRGGVVAKPPVDAAGRTAAAGKAGRPGGHLAPGGRPGGHIARPAAAAAPAAAPAATSANAPIRDEARRPLPPTFDPENPYR
jgi:endoglucanase